MKSPAECYSLGLGASMPISVSGEVYSPEISFEPWSVVVVQDFSNIYDHNYDWNDPQAIETVSEDQITERLVIDLIASIRDRVQNDG